MRGITPAYSACNETASTELRKNSVSPAARCLEKAVISVGEHRTSNIQQPTTYEIPTCFAPCSPSTTSPRPSPPLRGGEGDGTLPDRLNASRNFDDFYRACSMLDVGCS